MPPDRKVHFKTREVYGVERIYPVCDNAKLFVKLTGRKCLTRQDLAKIVELGGRVVQMTDPIGSCVCNTDGGMLDD